MSVQYRIKAIMTDGSKLTSDAVYVDEIQKALQESGQQYDLGETFKLCMDEIRVIFADLRDKRRDTLTLLMNGSEIAIMRKGVAILVVEVQGDQGNQFNVPEKWVPLNGIELQPQKAQQH